MNVVLGKAATMDAPASFSASLKYRAMVRQSDDIRRLQLDGWRQARQAADLLDGAERLILTGVGTSFHAAMVAGWMFRSIGFDARAINASDIWLYPDQFPFRSTDAVIVISHTGAHPATRETLTQARNAGSTLLSVGSLSTEHEGSRLILRTVERESAAGFTASHMAAMYVLAQVVQILGERIRPAAVAGWRKELDRLPGLIEATLQREDEVIPVARAALGHRIFTVGAGPNEATIQEFLLRATEAEQSAVESIGLEQFLHGPIVTAAPGDVGIIVRSRGPNCQRLALAADLLGRLGVRLWIVGEPIDGIAPGDQFVLPPVCEMIAPLLTLVPIQMLAHQIAVLGGDHAEDKPFTTRQAVRFCSSRPM
jgi:glutamine---fructose-6-phosphate transaminase (isomerizing)